MDKFVIRGGNPLAGTIRVSGAKNSALPCMAAAILTEDEVTLENIPQVWDIATQRRLLSSMGAEVKPAGRSALRPPSVAARSPTPSQNTKSSRPCAPVPWCSARSLPAPEWRAWPCPADAPSAAGPSICTSRAWRRWASASPRSTAIWMRGRSDLHGAHLAL